MTKNKVWDFTVEGRSPFPIDMLRYDVAIPASESESAVIEVTSRHIGGAVTDTVRLTSRVKAPTPARWKSFGWTVTDVKERRVS